MNFVLFGLILISCHVRAIETNDYLIDEDESNKFYDFLERFRDILRDGNETLGIQSLDPFLKEKSEIHIDNFIVLDTTFTNITVNGLSDYDVINGNCEFHLFPKPNITVNFSFTLNATTSYEGLTGEIDRYDLYGDRGDIDLYAENLNLAATIHYTLGDDWEYMIATEVETELSLQNLILRATGLMNNEDASNVASFYISGKIPKLIEEKQEMITTELGVIFTNAVNDFASSWTFKEILDMMGIDPFTDIGSDAI